MKKIVSLILIFCFSAPIFAQKPTDASQLFEEGRYEEAAEINRKLLKRKPNDAVLNHRLARCLLQLGEIDESIVFFEKAANNGYHKAYQFLGDIYFERYQFGLAAEAFESLIEKGKLTAEELKNANEKLQKSQLGEQLLQRVEDIAIIDQTRVPKSNFLAKIELPHEIGAFFTSKNGETVFESGRGDRRLMAKKVGEQTDIYESFKLMGEWSTPTPLSNALNSNKNDNYPFVAADGITLFLGSENRAGIGGYDIFMSRYSSDAEQFLTPKNIGFPFNSPANDYLLAIDEQNGIGWLVTDRFSPSDKVDIFRFAPNLQHKIVRDSSETNLIALAKLTKFRKAELPKKPQKTTEKTQKITETPFIINDSTIYYTKKEFKNVECQKKFVTLQTLKSQLLQKKFTLQAKRELWELCETTDEQTVIASEIEGLEKTVLNLTKEISRYEHTIRRDENQFLRQILTKNVVEKHEK